MAIDTFNPISIKELALIDFSNLEKLLKEDYDIIDILNTIDSKEKMEQYLLSFSPFERYPYYKDYLPTLDYLKDVLDYPFEITENITSLVSSKIGKVEKLDLNIKYYKVEEYRKNIYPFSSDLYLSYINKTKFTDNEFNFNGNLYAGSTVGFIHSPNDGSSWVKSDGDYKTNLFSQKLKLNNTSVNILNTPYFHKQLFNDFNRSSGYGKYAGSAYLLINSLPFLDLEDKINFNEKPKSKS
jgi:hypothetical protein